ncbi:IS4/Tn5 family transposase DNA-binding protein [Serratia quinivorans]|uniref:IS4/Tn5 family transposase DNA-binding protein n=1 Tax=Serratia quinivorans TaxID=137545 RepID=UPI0021B7333E|nr:transposase [Serratia quinivorans]
MSWAEEKLRTVDLGDTRLDCRAVLLLERLGQKPSARRWCTDSQSYETVNEIV